MVTANAKKTPHELRRYRPDVEGLRAVAILIVLLDHFAIPGFSGGAAGVTVFFVISGFVITSMLIRKRGGSGISLSDFFARRCRRIIPVATVVVLVSILIERVVNGKAAAAALVQPGRLILLFVFNWDTSSIDRLLIVGNPITAYWSLSVEEQFYLVLPPLLILAGLVGSRWAWRTKAESAVAIVTVASFAWAAFTRPMGLPGVRINPRPGVAARRRVPPGVQRPAAAADTRCLRCAGRVGRLGPHRLRRLHRRCLPASR